MGIGLPAAHSRRLVAVVRTSYYPPHHPKRIEWALGLLPRALRVALSANLINKAKGKVFMGENDPINAAYLRGRAGLPSPSQAGDEEYTLVTNEEVQGPIELLLTQSGVTPAFIDTESAYEGGRCLRMIGYILDRWDVGVRSPSSLFARLAGRPPTSEGTPCEGWTVEAICVVAADTFGIRGNRYHELAKSALSYSRDRPKFVVVPVRRHELPFPRSF